MRVIKNSQLHTFNNVPLGVIMEPYRISAYNRFLDQFEKLKKYGYVYSYKGGGKLAAYESLIPCIARFAIMKKIYTRSEILGYDTRALTTDPRYRWSKTPNGRGARSKTQKSYR